MIITKKVEVKWNSKTKSYYIDKGYKFTKMKDSFMVKTEDLTNGSNIKILVRCDYCNNEYNVTWHHRVKSNLTIDKDCCKNCSIEKQKELNIIRYGVEFPLTLDKVKNKRKETLLSKYGVENIFQLNEVKEKICKTNIEKYGNKCCLLNDDIKTKSEQTMMSKYGAKNYSQSKEWVKKYSKENSPRWKGGVKYHRVERATFEYNLWRKSVFKRDKFTCRCCNKHSKNLQAHHILNWKNNKDLRYNIDNGITFCKECHIKFHQIYGKKDNTNMQVEEFIINNG